MPERWRMELRLLRTLEPGPSLWERAAQGPRLEVARPSVARRTVVLIVIIVLVAAVGFATWHALEPLARRRELPAGGDSLLQLPPTAGSPGTDRRLGARLVVRTFLPPGTIVMYRYDAVGPTVSGRTATGGGGTGVTVTGGSIRIGIVDDACYGPVNGGTGFTISMAVGPRYDGAFYQATKVAGGEFGHVTEQPQAVLDRFGRRFERLSGANVTTDSGDRVLLVRGTYAWPRDACGGRGG